MVNIGDRVSFIAGENGEQEVGTLLEIKQSGEYTVKLDDGEFFSTANVTTIVGGALPMFDLGTFVSADLMDGEIIAVITKIEDGRYQVVDKIGQDYWVSKEQLRPTNLDFDSPNPIVMTADAGLQRPDSGDSGDSPDDSPNNPNSPDTYSPDVDSPDAPGLGLGTAELVSFESDPPKIKMHRPIGPPPGPAPKRSKPKVSADAYVKIGIAVLFAAMIYNN
jgi:hypothetical protein